MDVSIYHLDGWNHQLRAMVLGKRGGWHHVGEWSWKGIGVPAPLLADISARIHSAIEEHLVTRYGVAGVAPEFWEGGPGIP